MIKFTPTFYKSGKSRIFTPFPPPKKDLLNKKGRIYTSIIDQECAGTVIRPVGKSQLKPNCHFSMAFNTYKNKHLKKKHNLIAY